MMRKNLTTLLLFIAVSFTQAQSNIRPTNYWENTYYINPASINDQYFSVISGTVRKQWVKFPGSPSTAFFTGTIFNSDLHTQFGIRVLRDKVGYTSTADVDLTYSYALELNKAWKLNFGLSGSYQNLSYDVSQIKFATDDDPSIYSRLKKENNYNADLGMELVNKNWIVGASGQNIFSLFTSVNQLYTNTNFLYAKYRPYSQGVIGLGYGACAVQYAKTYQMELNLTAYFKKSAAMSPFEIGVIYRTWSEMGVIFGLDLTKNMKLSYSYDYNVGGISQSSYGTHELMLSYRFDKKWRCHNCWF